jgi:predicted phage terminase large subunit-like protein
LPASQLEKAIRSLTDAEANEILYDWSFWARPLQLPPPGEWRTWLILAGRGGGKTRAGAEWVKAQVERHGKCRIALVGRTSADCRKVMVEGEAGILSVFPPDRTPHYEPSRRQITFSNGAIAITYSSEEPDLLRGPAHSAAWIDELATFFDADVDDEKTAREAGTTWSNLQMGLRLGDDPRQVVTTTPRPIRLIKKLMADPSTAVSRWATKENRQNLSPQFYAEITAKYGGTRLGRQELEAEILEEIEGALFNRQWIDAARVKEIKPRQLQRIVVAIDPAVTNTEDSDETGIIVAAKGVDDRGYILADGSCRLSPDGWARRAVDLLREYSADRIVAEVNNGGDLVERVIRTVDARVPYKAVHASRGKITRAEPIAALFEQGRISMVGFFPELESQMCGYTGAPGEKSPDRLDSLVYALTELFLEAKTSPRAMWL